MLINPAKNWNQANQHALELAKSALASGHEIDAVFFYGSSVNIANETNKQKAWDYLIQQQSFKLYICSTMIETLEITAQPALCFSITGMSQLTDSMVRSDKIIEIC